MPSGVEEDRQISLKLFVVLSKAYKTLMDKAVKDIREYRLSPSEFAILDVLYNKGSMPIQQIGEKILITSGTITYNIDKLESRGLLARVPCQEDRRVIFAELTEAGFALFDEIFPRHAAKIHEMMSGLTQQQQLEAIDLLKSLGKNAI